MTLDQYDLLPGVVQSTSDPEYKGRIKCIIPGIFETGTSTDNLPWVFPLGMSRYQSFSKMMKGSKVWVLRNRDNKFEYWYLPMFDYHSDVTKSYVSENYDNDPEVIICRDSGGKVGMLTYDDTNGFKERLNEDYIHLAPDNKIELKASDAKIIMEGSKITIGQDGDTYEPAVLGNTLVDILNDLQGAMGELKSACAADQHTMPLQTGFQKCLSILSRANTILCTNTSIN